MILPNEWFLMKIIGTIFLENDFLKVILPNNDI